MNVNQTSDEDRIILRDALRGILARSWPVEGATERARNSSAVLALWSELCDNGIAHMDDIRDLAMVMSETGRAAAPAPIIGTAITRAAIAKSPDFTDIRDGLNNASVRIAVAFGHIDVDPSAGHAEVAADCINGDLAAIEDWSIATHLLVFTSDGIALVERAAANFSVIETPGYAEPSLVAASLREVPCRSLKIDREAAAHYADLARLLLIARAAGSARRGLELAIDYVQLREQFGQVIGRFQALQHKLADCAVALDVTELMIVNAAQAMGSGDGGPGLGGGAFEVCALMAYASPALRRTLLDIHHGFGAVGYAEAHELPRHFRRVHADTSRLGGALHARLALGRRLLNANTSAFPALGSSLKADAVRSRIRAWLNDHWTTEHRMAARQRPFAERDSDPAFVHAAGAEELLAISWPKKWGGLDWTPLEQLAFIEETEKASAPLALSRAGSWLIAPALIQYGTDEQREHYLPGIARGDLRFCLGYSEPQAGSDLASLRTRAIRDGDSYIITGQKLWTTLAETATHVFLAVRTDPDAKPKHAGISLFVVSLDSPGITINPGMALYGRTFSTVYYDDVRVPAANMVGQCNGGWQVLTSALASERVLMGGQVAKMIKLFEDMITKLRPRASDAVVADRIGTLAADLHAARLLSLRSVNLLERGASTMIEGAISKLFSGDLAERLGESALELFGTAATLTEDAPGSLLDGAIEQYLRYSIMAVIGGGTAEIQRTLIAQRGLGLPR